MNWEIDFGSIALNWPWSGSEIKNCQVVCTLVQWTGAGIKDCQEPCRVGICQKNYRDQMFQTQFHPKKSAKIPTNLIFKLNEFGYLRRE